MQLKNFPFNISQLKSIFLLFLLFDQYFTFARIKMDLTEINLSLLSINVTSSIALL